MARDMPIFRGPQCLINTERDGKLRTSTDILQQLEKLERPLVVVAIAGLYRTGKSYLMNRLAGRADGFALGSAIQSKTKGIWIWVCEHPKQPDTYLVLLDTEGLGDVEKGDEHHDCCIFSLATLLSSTLVYNAMGTINEDALAKLNFVTEMSKHISVGQRKEKNDDFNFDRFFPIFIFALRDFTLDLEIDGREVTADEYLEHSLTPKSDRSQRAERYNRPRLCIRKYFKKRKCFTFDRPVSRKKLKVLDTLEDKDLSSDFREEIQDFLAYVYGHCPVKTLENGHKINGTMLATMVTSYVDAIRSGAVPCIESAVKSLALIENSRAVAAGVQLYIDQMHKLPLPTVDDKTLNDHHFKCLKQAIKLFLEKAIMDDDNEFQTNMNEQIQKKFVEFVKANESASRKKCWHLLTQLEKSLVTKHTAGGYAKSGGFTEYQQDVNDVQAKYDARKDLGVQKKECLLEYIQQKMQEGKTILAADNKVGEREKQAEAERQKALAAERERQAAEREKELVEQYAEEKERAMKENIERMEEKREKEIQQLKEHYERTTQERIDEQQRLLKEGFEREANELRAEINKLKNPPRKRRGCVIM